jgi:hypothetical protein
MKKVILLMCKPIHWIVGRIARKYPHQEKVSHCIIGTIIAVFGVWLAHHSNPVLEFSGYWIHGFGGAPVAKVLMDYLEIEI